MLVVAPRLQRRAKAIRKLGTRKKRRRSSTPAATDSPPPLCRPRAPVRGREHEGGPKIAEMAARVAARHSSAARISL